MAYRIGLPIGIGLCMFLFAIALRLECRLSTPVDRYRGEEWPSQVGPFPRVAAGFDGRAIRLDRPPQAIASQALVIDHLLFAVTAKDRIVSVSTVAHNPRYSYVTDLLQGMDVAVATDPEAILRRRPDLVMLSHSARADFEEIVRSAGIPVFRMLTEFQGFDEIANALRIIGHVTGDDDAAQREIQKMWQRIERATSLRPRDARQVRILPYSTYGSTFGSGSLLNHIIEKLGEINVAAERGIGPVGMISGEQVAARDPEWIVVGAEPGQADRTLARMRADPGIAVSMAGKKGNIVAVDTRQLISMSHHATSLMETIASHLYRETP